MASTNNTTIITDKLLEIISTELLEVGSDFNEHTNLFDAGFDSLATMQLLIRLEQNFGIQLPASKLTKENFSSVADLEKLIMAQQQIR
jgi:acyl carrier protein